MNFHASQIGTRTQSQPSCLAYPIQLQPILASLKVDSLVRGRVRVRAGDMDPKMLEVRSSSLGEARGEPHSRHRPPILMFVASMVRLDTGRGSVLNSWLNNSHNSCEVVVMTTGHNGVRARERAQERRPIISAPSVVANTWTTTCTSSRLGLYCV